jgi:hypothetical protein
MRELVAKACFFGLVAAGATACNVDAAIDANLTLGHADAQTAADDSGSTSLAALSDLRLLGYRVSDTFHDDGHISVALLPRDAQGNAILDQKLFIKLVADCNVPFPMTAAVAVGQLNQPAPSTPFRMGVTLDTSGSMSSSDPDNLRVPAAGSFVDTIATAFPGSQFAAMKFGTEVTLLTNFTTDTAAFKSSLSSVGAEGSTAMHMATDQMLDLLINAPAGDFQPAMLVLSDGGDTGEGDYSADQLVAKANQHGIPISALALGGALDIPGLSFVSDLQVYAAGTNGYFNYVQGAASLNQSFENLAVMNSKGFIMVDVTMTGGVFVAFTTITISLEMHSGGQTKTVGFDFIVPLE